MKNHVRAAIFAGVLSSLLAGTCSSALAETDPKCVTRPHVKHVKPAHAKAKTYRTIASFSEKVRAAQMRLADLGYFVGYPDGKIGPKTRKALTGFQRNHSLKANGMLTDNTFETLCMTDYLDHHYYLTSVTDPKGRVFHASASYSQPGHMNPETGAWVVKGHDR